MSRITIEPAGEPALPACFALLPSLALPDAAVFVARDVDGVLAGAGGLLWRGWGRPPALPAWVHVLPDRRRRGIGSALIEAMATNAQEEGVDLVAVESIEADSEAARFAKAIGASSERQHYFFSADARNFQVGIDVLVRHLARRGSIPDEARVVPLSAASREEVKWLVAQEMATAPPQVAAMLSRQASGTSEDEHVIDDERSCVLMVGDGVAGALLSRRIEGGSASAIVCNVVAPAWRNGWANAMLLERFTQRTIDAGVFRIQFDCQDDVRDTIGLARRSKADRIATRIRFRYAAMTARSERRR